MGSQHIIGDSSTVHSSGFFLFSFLVAVDVGRVGRVVASVDNNKHHVPTFSYQRVSMSVSRVF